MNDYDKNVFGTENGASNENSETPISENGSFTPEESGEYRYTAEDLPKENEAFKQESVNANHNANPYSNTGAYPYTQQNNTQQSNPYSHSGNPYAQNNGTYPYGQQNQSYPYNQPYGAPGNSYQPGNRNYAYPEGTPQKKGKAGKIVAAILVVLALIVGFGIIKTISQRGATLPSNSSESGDPSNGVIDNVREAETVSTPLVEVTVGADGTLDATEVYKKVLPSSVGILVYSNATRSLASEGSGVIYTEDDDGIYTYIVTCAHVIKGTGQNIVVQLYNEKEYTAEVVGYDSRTDIGVLRIKASGLSAIEIGDSDKLVVGETVYAIGNPGGTEFANTFTNGIVTALDRPVASSATGYTMECIQHNVAINPGNSGGALLNRFGQLIGINSMKIVAADYEGMGFSVPSSVFVNVINDIVEKGYVTSRPKIGISYVKASAEQAYAMFVAIRGLPAGSIVIASISEDSDFYGKLKEGDLVTAINGKDLDSAADLAAFVEDMKVGDKITLNVVRINSDYSFEEVTLSGVLVEDKETPAAEEEESSTSYFDDYFGNRGGNGGSGSPFDDYFNDFFNRYFGQNP